eukprot:TRINITY_DN17801_c0_g1_i1.p1 TRINITY_DN17801_c0_g1~~TRINITY_DN17801_c0_g1_i1.p1  ORF type:complete len:262 (-),score=60.40 TRINITY_DN17801_c0_g1_i1:301-1086(-)
MRQMQSCHSPYRQHSARMASPKYPPILEDEKPSLPREWTVKEAYENPHEKGSRRSDVMCLAAIFVGTLLVIASLLAVFPQNKLWQLQAGPRRPVRSQYAQMARWLMAKNSWGVVSTISKRLEGAPFGMLASLSDGLSSNHTGLPYFYLAEFDNVPQDLAQDNRAALHLTEAQFNRCTEPENPTCVKATFSGKIVRVDPAEVPHARSVVFWRHPEMALFPKDHNFHFYKLLIEDIYLLDTFGGARPLTVDEYFAAHLGAELL